MKHIVEKNWTTGTGNKIDFYDLLRIVRRSTLKGSKVFIGTDSFVASKNICFASAVCLYGGNSPSRYFFFKENISKKQKLYTALVSRILEETRRSIEIGCLLIEEYNFDSSIIELHLDVSPVSAGNGTSKFSDMLKGYVQGYGFDFRLKPEAWASQSIADRHSK